MKVKCCVLEASGKVFKRRKHIKIVGNKPHGKSCSAPKSTRHVIDHASTKEGTCGGARA